jgi:hypothetical protein
MNYKTNVIVGKLGILRSVERAGDGSIKDTRSSGAVFYDRGATRMLQLTSTAMRKIVK